MAFSKFSLHHNYQARDDEAAKHGKGQSVDHKYAYLTLIDFHKLYPSTCTDSIACSDIFKIILAVILPVSIT